MASLASFLLEAQAKKAAGQNVVTPDALRQRALEVAQVDPSLQAQAGSAVTGGVSLASRLLRMVDAPRRAVVNALTGHDNFGTALDAWGVRGDDVLSKAVRGVGGFILDTAADPTTYLTGGAGALGKAAAKEAVLNQGLAHVAKRAGLMGADDTLETAAKRLGLSTDEFIMQNPALKEFGDRVTAQATKDGGTRNKLFSEVLRDVDEDVYEALPDYLKGGIRFGVPFAKSTERVLVPGKTTAQVTSKVAAAVKGNKAAQAAGRAFTVGHTAKESGISGTLWLRSYRAAKAFEQSLNDRTGVLLKDTEKVFNKTDPAQSSALFDAIWRGSRTGLTPEQDAVVDAWRTHLDDIFQEAENAGVPVQYLEQFAPRVISPEGRVAKFGVDARTVFGGVPSAAMPAGFRNRTFYDLDFDKAQEVATKYFGLDKKDFRFFSEDPFFALAEYARTANRSIAMHGHTNDMLSAGIFVKDLARTTDDIWRADITKAGFANLSEAINKSYRAMRGLDKKPDPRLSRLSRDVRELVDAHADELRAGVASRRRKAEERLAGSTKKANQHLNQYDLHLRRASYWRGEEQRWLDKVPPLQTAVAEARDLLRDIQDERALWLRDALARIDDIPPQASKKQRDYIRSQKAVYDETIAEAKKDLEKVQRALRSKEPTFLAKSKNARLRAEAAEDAAENSRSLADRQNLRVEARELEVSNAEAGLDAKGNTWPAPRFTRGSVPDGYASIHGTGLGLFEGKYAPAEIAEELKKNFRAEQRGDLVKNWDDALAVFKKWVTLPFPGFYARNLYGGFFNNYIGGVRAADYQAVERLLRGSDADAIDGLGTVAEVRALARQHGILAARHSGIVSDMVRENKKPGFGIPGLSHASQAVDKMGDIGMSGTENVLRGAAFISALRRTEDPVAARAFVMMRHGDYSELTHFERNVRRFIPFYKWMRVNVPQQFENLLENPGRLNRAVRFQEQILGDPEKRRELEEQGLIPDYLRQRGTIVSRFTGSDQSPHLLSLDLPFFDVNNVTPKGIVGALAPGLKQGVEAATGVSMFTKQPLRNTRPVSGVYHGIAIILEKLPMTRNMVARSKTGELRMNGEALALLSVVPQSRLMGLITDITSDDTGEAALSLFTGLRAQAYGPEAQQSTLRGRDEALDELVGEVYRRGFGDDFKTVQRSSRPTPESAPVRRFGNLF